MSRLTLSASVVKPFQAHEALWNACTDCKLHKSARQKVFYRGTIPAHVLFLGEAPGGAEDTLGYPFVGECGDVLSQVEAVIGEWNTTDAPRLHQKPIRYCVANSVLCRPPNNREPEREEIQACIPRLVEFYNFCKPNLVICVGKSGSIAFNRLLCKIMRVPQSCSIRHPGFILRKQDLEERKQELAKACLTVRLALTATFDPNFEEAAKGLQVDEELEEEELPF